MMLLTKPISSSPTTPDPAKLKTPKLKTAETKQALSPNQVVIIHQNNSIATNNLNLNSNELMSSMSSSSSSSINQPNTDTDSLELVTDDQQSDVKYMKGYVNVIKERFARRSLNDKVRVNEHTSSQGGAIRLSINDYQKRKQQMSTNSSVKTRNASVDYQRTRSVSPFSSSSCTNFKSNSEINTKQHVSLYNKNPPSSTTNKQRQDDDQKLFNSLSSPSQSSTSPSPPSSSYSSPDDFKKVKTEIIKCTYLNEINKDELPKPNFVSSVKNLFEKQMHTNSTDNLNSIAVSSLRPASNKSKHQRQSLIETVNSSSPQRISKSAIKKSVSIESLVDRLKQNGTLVYEHNEKENIEIQTHHSEKVLSNTQQELMSHQSNGSQPLSPVSLNTINDLNDKGLSFKERKELFNKNSPNSPNKLNVNNNNNKNNTNKRQKIEFQVDLNNESSDYNLNDDDSLSSNSSKQDESIETVLSATDVLNSATENQKNKKAKTPVKVITFYGGEEIKDVKKLNLQTKPVLGELTTNNLNNSTVDSLTSFEFVGAGIRLEKSNLVTTQSITQIKRKNGTSLRVNFTDTAETYEYPSFEFMLKELGIDPLTDPDYQCENENDSSNDNQYSNSFRSFLPGKSFSSDLDDEKTDDDMNYNKLGSFTSFKPSWHNMNYELGTIESYERTKPNNNSMTSSPLRLNTNGESFLINDILPSKDEHNKRWSSEMDSNILF